MKKKITPILTYIAKLVISAILMLCIMQIFSRINSGADPYDSYMGLSTMNETADVVYDGGITTKSMDIQKGSVQYETTEYQKANDELLEIVEKQNAVIMASSHGTWKDSIARKYRNSWYQINVPAEQLEITLKELEQSPYLSVVSQNVNLWDVTETVSDTQSRIKAKEQLINRYQELMTNATEVSDLIAITDAMSTAETELSELKRQQDDTKQEIRYSEISISVTEIDVLNANNDQISYGKQFTTAIARGFFDGIHMVGLISIWLLGHWLIIILSFIIVISCIYGYKKYKKGRDKRDSIL